jgi:DHA2 family multidrug resistance protein-like MFS transporter
VAGPRTGRWLALGAISIAIFAVTLDVTVLTVALPTLATALGASEAQLQWFVTAYTLALVAGMLPSGLLGDRYGRKTLMLGGLAVFAAGSIGCAVAPGPEAFIAARVALGLAGASLIVVALSVLTVLFDETERPRAIGIWGAANFIGLPLGPILGGWLLTNVWWGWIFLMNVPVALLALVAVWRLVPESRAPNPPGLDLVGVALSSLGLVALEYGIVEGGDHGWASVGAVVPAIAGLVVLGAFVAWERRTPAPLVDLRLFGSRSFTWGVVCTAIGVFGLFGVLFLLPQYFQAIAGLDPQGSGLRLLPAVLGLVIGAVSADRVALRIGVKLTVAIGFAVVAAGTLVGSMLRVDSGDAFMAGWTFVVGAGGGLGFATAAAAALAELDADRAGVGSALLQAVVKLGPAFGASIIGSVLNGTYQARVDIAGLPGPVADAVRASVFGGLAVAQQIGSQDLLVSVRAAFVAGIDDAALLGAIVSAVAIAVALIFLPRGRSAGEQARAMSDGSAPGREGAGAG